MADSSYTAISPDQVQAGDVYKFIPAEDGCPTVYGDVLQVLAGRRLVQVRWWDDGRTVWTYVEPSAGRAAFGRKNGVRQ